MNAMYTMTCLTEWLTARLSEDCLSVCLTDWLTDWCRWVINITELKARWMTHDYKWMGHMNYSQWVNDSQWTSSSDERMLLLGWNLARPSWNSILTVTYIHRFQLTCSHSTNITHGIVYIYILIGVLFIHDAMSHLSICFHISCVIGPRIASLKHLCNIWIQP